MVIPVKHISGRIFENEPDEISSEIGLECRVFYFSGKSENHTSKRKGKKSKEKEGRGREKNYIIGCAFSFYSCFFGNCLTEQAKWQ